MLTYADVRDVSLRAARRIVVLARRCVVQDGVRQALCEWQLTLLQQVIFVAAYAHTHTGQLVTAHTRTRCSKACGKRSVSGSSLFNYVAAGQLVSAHTLTHVILTYVYVHVCVCTNKRVNPPVCIHTCMDIHVYNCISVYIHIYIRVYVAVNRRQRMP